jgi:dUTP pyrophosphatase
MLANSVGIGDSDFRGDEDEYKAALLNFTDKPVTVEKGDRIAQGIFIKFTRGEWEEVEKMDNKTRGGFGSTGSR